MRSKVDGTVKGPSVCLSVPTYNLHIALLPVLIGNDVYDVTDNLPAAAAAALYKALAHESHVSEQFPQFFFGRLQAIMV